MNPAVIVKPVQTAADLRRFIAFPERLYKGNPCWVPPLWMDELNTLDKKKNPAFEFCEASYWLAYKGSEMVGRVAAILNHHANRDWKIKAVRFSWLDFTDDPEVSKALLTTVENWGKEKGMQEIQGPLGFTDMDKEGLMMEGFDKIPTLATWYNAPYYLSHLESLGYTKEADWLQNIFSVPKQVPEKVKSFSTLVRDRYQVRVLNPRSAKEVAAYGQSIFDALNRSFTPLYGFTPLTQAQIDAYIKQYLPMVNPKFVCIILDKTDQVVGFAITMPSLSIAMQKSGGKIFPFGFIHILKALKDYRLVDMYLIGIVPEYQNKGLNAIIFDHLLQNFIEAGVKQVITNPQLEENTRVRSLFEGYEGEAYMRRRCFLKHLGSV